MSNIDENHIIDTVAALDPEATPFVIASKGFTTQAAMVNAKTTRAWLLRRIDDGPNCRATWSR